MQTLERLLNDLVRVAGAVAMAPPTVATQKWHLVEKARADVLAELARLVAGGGRPAWGPEPTNAADYRTWRYWLVNEKSGLIEDGHSQPGTWRQGNGYVVMENPDVRR